MPQSTTVHRRIVLAARPRGAPTALDFRIEESSVPKPGPGQVLLRTRDLSLDPYMRGRMAEGPSYAAAVAIGDVMVGATVSRVEASRHPGLEVGALVLGYTGWQDYALSDGTSLTLLDPEDPLPSRALGVLGMPGFTDDMGLLDIGRPSAAETIVVAAASGAFGSVVGPVAKIKGCQVVGIAGGSEKCRHVVDQLGFEDDAPRWSEFADAMREWVSQGRVKVREDIVFGLENAPDAFIGLLQGRNFGKLVIQLAPE